MVSIIMAVQNLLDYYKNFLNVADYIGRLFLYFYSQPLLLDFGIQ